MKLVLTFLVFFSNYFALAQTWRDLLLDSNANFYDVQRAFYQNYDTSVDKKSYGVKQFKRWEHLMKNRVFPTGEIIDFNQWVHQQKGETSLVNNRSANWQSVGPNYWSTLVNGTSPGNGRVNSLVVHPSNPLIIYIATSGGGIWKTTDGGVNWNPLTDNLPTLKTSDIIIDENNPNTLFFATGDNDTRRSSLGIYKTTDGGSTWTLSLSFNNNTIVGGLLMDPNNSNLIYCSTNKGLYRSLDGGMQWLKLNSTNLYNIKIQPNNPSVIYATEGTGNNVSFLKSIDSGLVFNPITIPILDARRIEIEVLDAFPNYIYLLAASSNNGFGGLYFSKDYGATWETMSTSPNIIGTSVTGSSTGGLGDYALAIEVNPINPAEVIIGGINVWKSNDTGHTWQNLSNPTLPSPSSTSRFTHPDIHFLKYYGTKLFCGSDGGIFTSDDYGVSWNNLSKPLNITEVYVFSIYTPNPTIMSLGSQDNGTFINAGWGWRNINSGDGFGSAINQSDPNHLIYSIQNGKFYYTNDGGFNRYNFFSSFNSNELAEWHTPLSATKHLDTVLIAHENIWYTLNNGSQWTKINIPQTSFPVELMTLSPSNNQVIYYKNFGLYKALVDYSSGTATVTNIGASLISVPAQISSIFVHPNNDSIVWVTFSGTSAGNKVYKTTDAGLNWQNISYNLPNVPVSSLSYSELHDVLYVGTDAGVYLNENSSSVWNSFNSNLPNAIITKIIVDDINSKVFVSTYGRGIWKSDAYIGSSTGIKNQYNSKSVNIFPNPTSSKVNIESSIKVLNVEVFDVLGKKVKSIINNNYKEVDLDNLKNGVYYFNILLKNQQKITKKIVKS